MNEILSSFTKYMIVKLKNIDELFTYVYYLFIIQNKHGLSSSQMVYS